MAEAAVMQLEAAANSGRLIDAYQPAEDRWSVPFAGPFWDAVAHAHALGQRGAGRRIAIIDTACDLAIPALKARVDNLMRIAPEPVGVEDTSHGTAVALLIARVAPDARLDVYSVAGEQGRIDPGDVAAAIEQAAQSSADIINLSLGTGPRVPGLEELMFHADPALRRDLLAGPHPWAARAALTDAVLPHANCPLCAAASAASGAGKMVFAAAGNDGEMVMCPARASGVVALGFTSEQRTIVQTKDGETAEAAASDMPHAPQSLINDISLREVDGVLGTSFASPLFAGAAALGVTPGELAAYLDAVPPGMFGNTLMNQIDGATGEARQSLVAGATANFTAALQRLPHVHSRYEALVRNGAPATEPGECVTCGLFAHPTYTNAGLWLMRLHRFPEAASLLAAAVQLAPWSADAAANYGRALEFEGQLAEALRWYDIALILRPGFPACANHRALLLKAIQAASPRG